ncbi:hypothetical protein [Paenibacillus luteus]|uniref:hypothetical protein n=1 Tax=Paenibacillus luteus TaxID=2545753 RepID=UPI0011442036|nr:hypothetical protein [Paenibacillus luteus]
MTSSMNEGLGVATSGVIWDVGDFKLFQSSREDTILFTKKQPSLSKDSDGRYHFSLFIYREQTGDTYKITGGSVIFTLTSAIQYSIEELSKVKDSWRTTLLNSGNAKSDNPNFIPLRMEGATSQLVYDQRIGTPHSAHNDIKAGIQGGTNTFLIDLTELGAQVCEQGIKEKGGLPFGVLFSYDYLRWLPRVSAEVHLDGKKTFEHFSTAFKATYGNRWVSVKTEIETVWENMQRDGAVSVHFTGTGTPEVEQIKSQLVTTFLDQALKSWFALLFEPVPEVEPASTSGGGSGFLARGKFAMKWVKKEDAVDLNLTIDFDGWSSITQDTDVGGAALFAGIDESYITDVQTQISYPAAIVVDPDEMLENVGVSWSASDGENQSSTPQSPVFTSEGGNKTYTVTSQKPDEVVIRYTAEINYKPNNWPIIQTSGEEKGRDGRQLTIKTSSWVGRLKINMEIRDGNQITPHSQVSKDDYLTVNIAYSGPHLSTAIKESMRVTPNEPLEFAYPIDMQGRSSTATMSIFGVIGGNLIQTNEQPLDLSKVTLYLLANKDGVEIVAR